MPLCVGEGPEAAVVLGEDMVEEADDVRDVRKLEVVLGGSGGSAVLPFSSTQ